LRILSNCWAIGREFGERITLQLFQLFAREARSAGSGCGFFFFLFFLRPAFLR